MQQTRENSRRGASLRNFHRGNIHVSALMLSAILMVGLVAPAHAQPEPTYSKTFRDCVTGDNQFYNTDIGKFRWYVNQAVGSDGSTGSYRCDSYQNDQYERPTSQTFVYGTISQKPTYSSPASPGSPTFLSGLNPDSEFAVGDTVYSTDSGIYHEYVDITRARAGYDEQWMFFRIELFGDYEVDSDAKRTFKFGEGTYYTVRLGNVVAPANTKANGGLALRNQWESNQPTLWNSDPSSVKVFVDTNGDVSGNQGVNFTKDDGDVIGSNDGYDLDRLNSGYLYVRKVTTSYTGPGGTVSRPAVEFAFNYRKYNQDFSANFTPASITYLEFDATRGLKDNQNYLWNDEYTLNEAGSPNPAPGGPNDGNLGEAGTSGTGNIYELDTLRGAGLFGSVCGDNVVNQPSEQCDGTDDDACPGACDGSCLCPPDPVCGDNVVNQPSEECDGTDDAACPGECDGSCLCPPATGACCIDEECIETTAANCQAEGGAYRGDGIDCAVIADDCTPLLVEFESLSAEATPQGVVIRWVTTVEIDTIGFRVLRETQASPRNEKTLSVVARMIPAAGHGLTGASYEVLDDSKQSAFAIHYYIEDVDTWGKVTRHGPIEVRPASSKEDGSRKAPASGKTP